MARGVNTQRIMDRSDEQSGPVVFKLTLAPGQQRSRRKITLPTLTHQLQMQHFDNYNDTRVIYTVEHAYINVVFITIIEL